MSYIFFDIGGTKTRVGTSDDLKTMTAVENFSTPATPTAAIKKIVTVAESLTTDKVLDVVVGGIRGVLNEDKTKLLHDGILTTWVGFDLATAFTETFKVPVIIENDTALAGLGEAIFGAGQGVDLVVYHTISTGVGGAKIEYGKIDEASIGFEPGHQVLDIDRTILGDDIQPTLENLISGRALEERTGSKPYDIPQDDVIWNELAGYLAQGLRNTILYWSPEVIVLGGSMMIGNPKIPLEIVRKKTVAVLDDVVPSPFITIAKLGDEAGLYGAMAYAAQTKKPI